MIDNSPEFADGWVRLAKILSAGEQAGLKEKQAGPIDAVLQAPLKLTNLTAKHIGTTLPKAQKALGHPAVLEGAGSVLAGAPTSALLAYLGAAAGGQVAKGGVKAVKVIKGKIPSTWGPAEWEAATAKLSSVLVKVAARRKNSQIFKGLKRK